MNVTPRRCAALFGAAGAAAFVLLGAPSLTGAATPTPSPTTTTASAAAPATGSSGVASVTVTPAKALVTSPVTVSAAWCLPATSVPGSMLALVVPPQLKPVASGFAVRDAAGDVVATAAVAGNTVKLSASAYVATHRGVCGTVVFPAVVQTSLVHVNTLTTLLFGAGTDTIATTFTPLEPVGAKLDEPITYGTWTNPDDQGRTTPRDALTWYLESPLASAADGLGPVHFFDAAGHGQSIDCAALHVELGRLDAYHHFVFTAAYRGPATTSCTSTRASVVLPALRAGTVARVVLPASVTSAARMVLECEVLQAGAVADLAMLLPRAPEAKGEVRVHLRTGRGREPWALLGQNFRLDSEVIERLIPIEGLANVVLTARPDRHLRLVE